MDAPPEKFDPSLVPSPRSRWLINSWTIAALTLGLAVTAMIVGMQAMTKHEFIERLQVQGAKVTTEAVGPDWLIEWGGPRYAEYLNRVVSIEAAHATLSRSDMAYISGLNHLRRLDLSNTAVSDDDIEVLNRLPALESINLRRTKVTDVGVDNLRQMHPQMRIEF